MRALPDRPGVYLMKDRLGDVLYVGKAKSLRKRVSSYFQAGRRKRGEQPKIDSMVALIEDIETIEVRSDAEAVLLEGRLIKEWKPKYNTFFTDDKHFLQVRVDLQNRLPRFELVRYRRGDQARYYGPFAKAGPLRKTLDELRSRFGILHRDAKPVQQEDGRWKLYDDLRSEIYTHENIVSEEAYRARVEEACQFLDGRCRSLLGEYEQAMQKAAERQDFERAAHYRDLVEAMRTTLEPSRRFTRTLPEQHLNQEGPEALRQALWPDRSLSTLECFDISHISGSFVVASMVRFVDGRPDRKSYRHFRIQSFEGNDDYAAMEEVVGRRYRRLHQQGHPFPDLVVIDGGPGQVQAALKAFLYHELEPPALIGLAKREEAIHFSDGRQPLVLPREHAGLRLLQHLRDEAHRFANRFNADLRSKRLRQSVLEDIPGLGSKRRELLWERFRGLEGLRKASLKELQEVEGIGPKLAATIREFLDSLPGG